MLSSATLNRRIGQSSFIKRAPAAAVVGYAVQRAVAARAAAAQPAPVVPPARAPAVAPGAYPKAALDALERYGGHAKAAYILFETWNEEEKAKGPGNGKSAVERANGQLEKMVKECSKFSEDIQSLKGYTWVSSMWGYATIGNVLSTTTPDADSTLIISKAEADAGQVHGDRKPTYLGYIAQGKGADGEKEMLVAFRGTSTLSDWIMNLLGGVGNDEDYERDKKKFGKVHHGFHALVHDIPDKRTEEVTPTTAIDEAIAKYNPTRIIVTGHSLGGAMATLAAAHIARNHSEDYIEPQLSDADYSKRRLQVYTLAAPRVGDEQLCSYFKDDLHLTVVQMKNEQDPTPYVAPYRTREAASVVGKILRRNWREKRLRLEENEDAVFTRKRFWNVTRKTAGVVAGLAVDALKDFWGRRDPSPEEEAAGVGKPLNVAETADHFERLAGTVFNTHWVDNPAPAFGVCTFSSNGGGKYGGALHSIEEYLRRIRE